MSNDDLQEVQPDLNEQLVFADEEGASEDVPTESQIDWRAEALKQAAINKRLKTKISGQKAPLKEIVRSAEEDKLWKEKIELEVKGYDEKEINLIMRNGGKAALEDEMVKLALNSYREQKRAEQAVNTDNSGGSEVEKRYKPEELKKMSAAELAKILPHAD